MLLILAAISFVTVIGGGIYEHLAIVPRWKLAPPASLTMFQGPYGLNQGIFWQLIHPATLLLLISALAVNWKNARKKYILVVIAAYVVTGIVTFLYFVPELLSIIKTTYQVTVDQNLVARAATWEKLSLVRMVFMIAMAIVLLSSLTKANENRGAAV